MNKREMPDSMSIWRRGKDEGDWVGGDGRKVVCVLGWRARGRLERVGRVLLFHPISLFQLSSPSSLHSNQSEERSRIKHHLSIPFTEYH